MQPDLAFRAASPALDAAEAAWAELADQIRQISQERPMTFAAATAEPEVDAVSL